MSRHSIILRRTASFAKLPCCALAFAAASLADAQNSPPTDQSTAIVTFYTHGTVKGGLLPGSKHGAFDGAIFDGRNVLVSFFSRRSPHSQQPIYHVAFTFRPARFCSNDWRSASARRSRRSYSPSGAQIFLSCTERNGHHRWPESSPRSHDLRRSSQRGFRRKVISPKTSSPRVIRSACVYRGNAALPVTTNDSNHQPAKMWSGRFREASAPRKSPPARRTRKPSPPPASFTPEELDKTIANYSNPAFVLNGWTPVVDE